MSFHVIKKDGQFVASVKTLGQAMDHMGQGCLMYMGASKDAIRIAAAIGRRNATERTVSGDEVLLHLGLEK